MLVGSLEVWFSRLKNCAAGRWSRLLRYGSSEGCSQGSSDMVVQKVVVDGAWRNETWMRAVACCFQSEQYHAD